MRRARLFLFLAVVVLAGCKESSSESSRQTPAETTASDPDEAASGTEAAGDAPPATDEPTADDAPVETAAVPDDAPDADAEPDAAPDDLGEPLRAVEVATDQLVSYARLSDGTVRAWGINDSGALGIGTVDTDAATPVEVQGLRDVTRIVAGGNTGAQTACALTASGKVWCWGARGSQFPGESGAHQLTPVEIPSLAGATDLCVGSNGHGCAVLAEGQVACWGRNAFGEVGVDGGTELPKPVEGGALTGAVSVGCGSNHSCARTATGAVWCWGYNSSGQVDPTSTKKVPTPRRVEGVTAERLFVMNSTTCIAGELRRPQVPGETPDATPDAEAERDEPTEDLVETGLICWGRGHYQGPKRVEGLDAVVAASGTTESMCALDDGGVVRCWGDNRWGQIGTGEFGGKVAAPTEIGGFDGPVVSVSAGEQHACAATESGAVYCWGLNQRGGLGDGTLQDRAAPTPVKSIQDRPLPPAESGFQDVKEADETTDWSGLPEGCTHSPTISLTTPRREGDTLDVVSAYAWRQDETSYDLRLANHRQFTDDLYAASPRAEQVVVSVKFFKADDVRSPQPIDAGRYDFSTDNARWMLPHIEGRSYDYTVANLTLEGVEDAGHVELTYVAEDWLCGHLAVRTRDEVIEGDFAARVLSPTR